MSSNFTADINKATALFISSDGKLLITRDFDSQIWTAPGGTIEGNESKIECLHREIWEELKAKIVVEEKMYKESEIFPAANDPGKTVKLFYFFTKFQTEPQPSSEIEEIHWLTRQEFENKKFVFSKSAREFLVPSLIADGILK